MDVTCERCATEYEFDDALVSETGTSVRCTQCGHRFKVRRKESVGAPEVWIVRTVDGSALEFRALRDLKAAIGNGRVGRDDVLSRGAGRPRRLASIAELEPFFSPTPSLLASTNQGLGQIESSTRQRYVTPSGIGPVGISARTEHSVAIPLPRGEDRAAVSVRVPPPTPDPEDLATTTVAGRPPMETNPFDTDEVTHNRSFTRELVTLGQEPAPVSVDPPTLYERDRFPSDTGPRTIAGVSPPTPAKLPPAKAPPPKAAATRDDTESLTKTTSYGTPSTVEAAAPASRAPQSEPTTTRKRAAESASTPHGFAPITATGAPADPGGAAVASQAPAAVAQSAPPAPTPAPPPSDDAPRSHVLPPAPDPNKAMPAATPKPEAARAASNVELEDAPARPQRRSRPTIPGEARYSFSNEDTAGDVMPSERRTSAIGSRRSSAGSVRLIVGVLVCGAMIFVGILLVQRFLPKQTANSATPDARVEAMLEAGEASFKDGDLDAAKEQFVKASALAEKDPRVAKALARLAIVRAEIAWLELLVATADDPGREATRRRYSEAADVAAKAGSAASDLAASDPDVARIVCDSKRLQGDVSGARKLVDRFSGPEGQPDTLVSLAALDLAEKSPEWRSVIDRLNKAADQEANLGRARALLVYALARSGDAKGARLELGKLGKLPRTHPLEAQLTRFVERSENGENLANLDDLPSIASSKPAASGAVDAATGTLKAAQEALARGNLDQAEKLFEKAVAEDANSIEGLTGLAGVARQRGQAKRAIGIYERVLGKNANNVAATVALADLKWDAGDQGAARTLYRKAIDLGVAGVIAERARSRMGGIVPESSTSSGADPQPTTTAPTATATVTPPPDIPPWEGSQ
jgi:predicted Zn finger-like uncharacterized protein